MLYPYLINMLGTYLLPLIYVSGRRASSALMYSIISNCIQQEVMAWRAFSPPAKFELGHAKGPAGHFSLHKCSFHGTPVTRQIHRQSSFSYKLVTLFLSLWIAKEYVWRFISKDVLCHPTPDSTSRVRLEHQHLFLCICVCVLGWCYRFLIC